MLNADNKVKTRDKIDEVMNSKVDTKKSAIISASDYKKFVPKIQKRDGTIVAFDFEKIVHAIAKAMEASNEGSQEEAAMVAHKVAGDMVRIARKYKNFLPTVEGW